MPTPLRFPLLLLLLPIKNMASSLSCVARYVVRASSSNPFSLVISSGSVVDFSYRSGTQTAIVNAANEGCLGGGGVDGAISAAGGPNLLADRRRLPVLSSSSSADGDSDSGGEYAVRCRTGGAVSTGPGDYGSLGTSHVIHAVGPNYWDFNDNISEGDRLLSSAYRESMERAKEAKLSAVAFSLISAGVFRGKHSQREVLKIGMEAIVNFEGYHELEEVHLCAFSLDEEELLGDICTELGLVKE